MMHKSLVTKRFQSEAIGDIHEDSSDEIQGDLNESVDMFNDEGGANSRLASPGMEHLLEEQQEANKRIPKNVKFNRAFDIAKVTAEYMKDTGTEQFELYMKCFSKFSNMVRDGIPSHVIDLLLEPGLKSLRLTSNLTLLLLTLTTTTEIKLLQQPKEKSFARFLNN